MSLAVFALLLYYFSRLSKRHEKSETKYKLCVEIFIQTIWDIICLQKSSWTFITKPPPSGTILQYFFLRIFLWFFSFLNQSQGTKLITDISLVLVKEEYKTISSIFSCIPWIICLDFGASVMVCDALHETFQQFVLLIQTHFHREILTLLVVLQHWQKQRS